MTQSCFKYIYFGLFCLGFLPLFGQQKACDCPQFTLLEKDINTFFFAESRDTQEVNRLTINLLNSNDVVCRAKGYEFLAEFAFNRKLTDSVDIYLNLAQDLLKRNDRCADNNYFKIHLLRGDYFYLKSNYNDALSHYYKALAISETQKEAYNKGLCFLKIAQIFNRMAQSDKGIEYARQSLPIIENMAPSVQKAYLLTLAAARYYFYYQDSKKQTYLDSTFTFIKSAKTLGLQLNNRKILIQVYARLENIETIKKNYSKALIYNDSVLMYCVSTIHKKELYVAYGDRGHKFMELGNYVAAKKCADSAVYYAIESKEAPAIANAKSLVFSIAKKSGNWQEAALMCEDITTINDSLKNSERTKIINELEKKYNQAKNEKTIKELAQEKRIYLLIALAALLGIVAFAFYLRQLSLKHKQKVLETEQRLNRARMNPHFFFNALTSLQSFALRENDGKTLASNLSKFSNIMRETLESTYKEYVTIEQEMDFLNEYLDIQKIRFPKMFNYAISAENDVEIDELVIPAMIIQPFVENAIEHGFAGLAHEGRVNVSFKKRSEQLLIEISDNGKGLHTPRKMSNEHVSRASQIIQDRIYLLNIKLKTKARFSIDNQAEGQGVLVKIYLPILSQDESISH